MILSTIYKYSKQYYIYIYRERERERHTEREMCVYVCTYAIIDTALNLCIMINFSQ